MSNALPQLCATELGTENTEPVQEVGQTDSGGGHGSNGDRVSDTNNSGDSSESIHSNSSLMIDKFDNEYQFLEVPNKVYENEKIDLEIAVKSMDNSAHDYLAHAYLYKGAFCYSCNNKSLERDENKISFSVAVDEVNYQKFELILDKEINPGDYKIKVKFQKDDRKTFDEITTNISIVKREEIMENVSNGSENSTEVLDLTAFDLPDKQQNSDTGSTVDLIESEESSEDGNESATSEPNTSSSSFGSRITGAITNPLVYQSTGSRAKLLVPGLIIVSCLVMMILVWKKKF